MSIIHKWDISGALHPDGIDLPLRKRHAICHVGEQNGKIILWTEVDPATPIVPITIKIIGTGWEFDAQGMHHIGTVQMSDGLVWHIFVKT